MEKILTVTIINWDHFNPRTDVQASSWFRFEHSFFENPQFWSFSNEEKLAFLYLLCCASKKKNGTFLVNLDHAKHFTRLKASSVQSAINKLQELGILTVDDTRTLRGRNADVPLRTNERTNETNVTTFDFESVYVTYPRKEGKTEGLKKCRAQIKTVEDFEQLRLAIENYSAHVRRSRTEPKFIKHFSTFMGGWRDWVSSVVVPEARHEYYQKPAEPHPEKMDPKVAELLSETKRKMSLMPGGVV